MNPRATRPNCFSCGQHGARLVDRDGEPDVAGPRADRRVDADHFAARVDERPAAVAEVDRGVGLDVVVEALVEQLPSDVADDADGHRVLVGQRVADGAHPLADAQRVGIAERRRRKRLRALHLDQRDVGVRIRSDDMRAQRAAVGQLHGDPIGALDHVVVREDVPVGLDDHAAAGAATRRVHVVRPRFPRVHVPVAACRRLALGGCR